MAKNDLVVKLLLDSGAFGDDLRQAERRAKEFGDKMKSAGDTAGKFTNEIGLSAGAFSKLGGFLTGAGGVIAAIGAFKSVMMSSHDSAKKFQGVIGGFSGVLDSLQYSFSTFDFTNFNKGLKQVYENAKQAKQAIMDAQLSTIAYDVIDKDTRLKLKQYEKEYKDPKTTPERREELSQLRDELLNRASITAAQHAENLYESILKQLIGKNSNIGDLEGDIEKTKQLIPFEELRRIMLDASMDIIFDADEALKEKWDEIKTQMTMLDNSADISGDASEGYMLYAPPKWLEFLPWVKKSREKWKQFQGQSGEDAKKARAEWEKMVMEYQELMIKNVLFTIGEEPLAKLTSDMEKALDTQLAVEDLILQGMGWSAPSTGGSSTGGSSTTNKKDPVVRNIRSKNYLKEMIAAQQEIMDDFDVGTSDWWDAVDAIDAYQTELNELEAYQNLLLGIADVNKEFAEGSMAYYDKLIKEYEDLIKEKEDLRYITKIESEEWHKLTEEIKEYTKIVDKLKEKRGSTSTTSSESKNEELEKKRKAAVDAWNEREKYDRESDAWAEANERLKEYVAEYQKFVQTLDKNDPIDRLQKKWANANIVVSSSVSLLSALSDTLANSEDESARKAGAWVDVLSTIGAGVQSYISIMQSAIATDEAYAMAKATGQAAMLPFPANIAAIATAVATITSVIAKINSIKKSANKFAEGGIVGGTSYSGDKLFAMVNSGEMILNKRQQRNLGNMLGGGGGQVEFVISGDSLVGVLNNKRNKTNLTR